MVDERITRDSGVELAQLELLGYEIASSRYDADSFGNWFVDLVGPSKLRVVRDRGQFLVDGHRKSLEKFGLWRAFNDRAEFAALLLAYAAR